MAAVGTEGLDAALVRDRSAYINLICTYATNILHAIGMSSVIASESKQDPDLW
jgi:hypothetical protein